MIAIDLRWFAEEAIDVRVEPESPAESAGIHPGWKGDSLLHAIAEFVTPHGDRLEGGDVSPDVTCAPTRADWAAGKDLALAAAVEWIVHGQ